jgi:hypothetical protein
MRSQQGSSQLKCQLLACLLLSDSTLAAVHDSARQLWQLCLDTPWKQLDSYSQRCPFTGLLSVQRQI